MSAAAVPLYPYQQRWFLDRARFKAGMFSRQSGKTFTTTLEVTDDCFAAAAEGRRQRWVILSRGERQAREAMDEGIKRHAQAYGVAINALEYDWQGQEASYRALEVELPHGSRITALPANPDTARGFSANVFLDEFAFHAKSREIWKALFPVISAGHKLRVVSTPNGKGNKFYEIMTGDDGTWSRHVVDIYQAVADGLPRDIDELRAGIADADAWAQEYECQWLDEATAWLPYDLIFSVEHALAGKPEFYTGGPCYIGNDIAAGGGDLWVAWVLEKVGDVLWTREIVELRRASFAEQDAVMDALFDKYRVVKLTKDQTGMGEKPVEDAIRRYGRSRVTGIHFTMPSKLGLATQGKAKFEDRLIRIPEGDQPLRGDLHSLIKIVGETGSVRFVAPREGGSHADRTWACFLAIDGAEAGGIEYGYEPVVRGGSGGGRRSFDRPHDDDDDGRSFWDQSSGLARHKGAF